MNFRRLALTASLLVASSLLASDTPSNSKDDILGWGDSPQAYLLTTQERVEWGMALSETRAEQFISGYWTRHGQAFRNEVLRRIAAADKLFPLGEKKGSVTERGRVFIILGAPNRERSNRNDNVASSVTNEGRPNSIEQRAFSTVTWIYKPDRLPKDLHVPELTVTFQIDVNRGFDTIENPGLIEPYLRRAIDYVVAKFNAPVSAPPTPLLPSTGAITAVAAPPVPPDDAVWNAGNQLNGAILTGDSYISPTDEPFYAVDFYLPKGELASLADDVVVAAVIRDATSTQIASRRTPAKLVQYDAGGDRFVDASFALPAGHYTAAFALVTGDGKVAASTRKEIDVMPIEHVGLSKVMMTSRIDTLETQQAFDPFTFVAMKYAVKGDRRFRAADKIAYFTVLANPATPEPSMNMKLRVSRDGKVVESGSWLPVQLAQTGPRTYLLATQFEANNLPPGHYLIEVQLRDMSAGNTKSYSTNAEFDVVP